MTSGIYRIDLGNDWFYIGSAVDLKKRESEHRRRLKRKNHGNQIMQNVWNKNTIFEFTILERCTKDELLKCEQRYLDKHFDEPKNVNICSISGSILGYIHTPEARKKMSDAAKFRPPPSAETRAKMSAANKRKLVSAETRAKMSMAIKAYHARKAQAA